MTRRLTRVAAAAVALACATGCFGHIQPASGTVAGFRQPVLLGPVDRLGGGKPMTATKVGEYEAESVALFTQATSDYGGYEVTTTTDMRDESEPYTHAITAVAGKGDRCDIRMTMVKARSYGTVVGYKNMVDLEGDVVTVGGAK